MHFYPSMSGSGAALSATGYAHCRSGSDSRLHRRAGGVSELQDGFDSGDSSMSDLDETESGSGSGSGSGVEVDPNLPYPGIAPLALGYLSQTTRPRSWCLALISSPYPFTYK
nr:unnamed protein product [Callosobruchus chinensis]